MAFATALDLLRTLLFWAAVVAAGVCAVDWLVRTRRLSPFSPVSRFFRRFIDPMMVPVERRIVRSGGLPAHAPWWTLVAIIVGGLILLQLVAFGGDVARKITYAASAPAEVPRLLIGWAFSIVSLALLVRVVSSWFRVSPYSKWIRWSYVLTEWMLAPLRRVIPAVGMVDITPLVAWLGLHLLRSVLRV